MVNTGSPPACTASPTAHVAGDHPSRALEPQKASPHLPVPAIMLTCSLSSSSDAVARPRSSCAPCSSSSETPCAHYSSILRSRVRIACLFSRVALSRLRLAALSTSPGLAMASSGWSPAHHGCPRGPSPSRRARSPAAPRRWSRSDLKTTDVVPLVSGRVEKVLVNEGDHVKADQPLSSSPARIRPTTRPTSSATRRPWRTSR